MHVKTCAGISCKTNMDEYVNDIVVHKVWPRKWSEFLQKINRFRHLLFFLNEGFSNSIYSIIESPCSYFEYLH